MKKAKVPLLSSLRGLIHISHRKRPCGIVLIAAMLSVPALAVLFALAGYVGQADVLPETWVHPIKQIIKYRESEPARPVVLSGGRKKQASGILTAIKGEAFAKLELWHSKKQLSPMVAVGPERQQTTDYSFPCPVVHEGRVTIGWSIKKAISNSKCGDKVKIAYLPGYPQRKSIASYAAKQRDNQGPTQKNQYQIAQNSEDQLSEQIEVSRVSDVTLILIQSRPDEITVDVLVGEVVVGSVSVTAGNRYIYRSAAGATTNPSPSNLADDPSVQQFLASDGWSPEAQKILPDFSPTQSTLSDTEKELLSAHNQCRARVGVPSLKWSSTLASFAQEWADQLSQKRGIEHRSSGGSGFGENIAAGGMTPTGLVNMWCDEQSQYNPQTGQCVNGDMSCYHFTQVVWKNTTEVGCGLASHRRYGKVLVCNYSPPGNYRGERPY